MKTPLDLEKEFKRQKENSKDYPAVDHEAVKRNYEGAMKTLEEQRKHPLDLEYAVALQKINAKDHANRSEYLKELQELQKRHGKEITER